MLLYFLTVSTNLSVEDLQFELNPSNRKHPTIRLTWRGRRSRRHHPTDIEYIIYVNDQEVQVVSGPVTSATISTLEPLKQYTIRVVARHKRTGREGLFYESFQTFLGKLLIFYKHSVYHSETRECRQCM